MRDSNLPMLEDAARKLAPFLDGTLRFSYRIPQDSLDISLRISSTPPPTAPNRPTGYRSRNKIEPAIRAS